MADAEVDAGINSVEELWDRDGWVLDLLLDMGKELRSVPMIGVPVNDRLFSFSHLACGSHAPWLSTSAPAALHCFFCACSAPSGIAWRR